MKLISIDVGIRHLAVCVMEGTSRKDMKIAHWDVIDVLGEKNGIARPLCFKCKKAGMWQKDTQFACSKHCPAMKIPTKTNLGKLKVEELQAKAKEFKLTSIPTKKPDLINAVLAAYKSVGWTKFTGGASVKHAPVLDLARDFAASLDSRREWWEGTQTVVIENQLDRRMFAVQALIHMYFVREGIPIVKGVSASHKLSNILTLEDNTANYRGRKKTGIVHCEQLMPADKKEFFRSHKKKDDLADSFLQGVWFLEHP
jgi:hypothetical protein